MSETREGGGAGAGASRARRPRLKLGTASNVLSLSGMQLVATATGLVLIPFLSRMLGKGAWTAYEGALGAFFVALSAVRGFEVLTMRRAARSTARLEAITGTAVVVGLALAASSGGAMLAWAGAAADGDGGLLAPTAIFAGALLVVPFGVRFALIARHRAHELTKATVAGQLVFAALVLGLVRGPGDVMLAAGAFVAGVVVVTEGMTWRAHRRHFGGWRAPPARLVRRWLGTSLPVVAARVLRNAMFNVDLLVLVAALGTAGAQDYTGAYKLAQVVVPFVLMLYAAGFFGFTHALREGSAAAQALARRYWEVSLGALVPLALCVAGVSGPLLAVVLGEGYRAGAPLAAILVCKLPLVAMSTCLRTILWIRRPRLDLLHAGLALVAQLAAIALLWAAGADPLLAAACGTVLGELVLLVLLVGWCRGQGLATPWPSPRARVRLIVAAVPCAATFALPGRLDDLACVLVAVATGGVALLIATGGHLLEQWRELTRSGGSSR